MPEWRSHISARTMTFVPDILGRSASFLVHARNPDGAWGHFQGFPTDLHASTLCIQALRHCDSNNYAGVITDSTLVLIDLIERTFANLRAQDAADALMLIGMGGNQGQGALTSRLIESLQRARNGFGWGRPEPSVSLTSEVLLALQCCSETPVELAAQTIEAVLDLQRADDGGFPVVRGGDSALIPSALMARVLALSSGDRYSLARERVRLYLERELRSNGWDHLGGGGQLYSAALVLRSAALLSDFPEDLLQRGISLINEAVTPSGGWCERGAMVPGVETTSLCILALVAAGETRYTPYRVAESALKSAESLNGELCKRNGELAENIRELVAREVGNVLKDNVRLKEVVARCEQEKVAVSRELDQAKTRLRVMRRAPAVKDVPSVWGEPEFLLSTEEPSTIGDETGREYWLGLIRDYAPEILTLFIMVSWSLMIPSMFSDAPLWIRAGISLLIILLFLITIYRRYAVRRLQFLRKRVSSLSADEIYRLARPDQFAVLDEISGIMSSWAPSKREDFIFRLSKEAIPIEAEDAEPLARYFGDRYASSESERRRLRMVLTIFIGLPISSRIEAVDLLRGIALRPGR